MTNIEFTDEDPPREGLANEPGPPKSENTVLAGASMSPTRSIVSVLTGPSVSEGGMLCRVVKMSDGNAVAETWLGNAWGPGAATLADVLRSRAASPAELSKAGISGDNAAPGKLD